MSVLINESEALLVLNALPQVGPVMLRHLMDEFGGDATAVLSATRDRRLSVKGVGDVAAGVLRNWEKHFDLARELKRVEESGIRFISQADDAYPSLLHEIYDSPIG